MPFIMLTALIDMISIGLIIPVLPALVGSFTGSQADQAFWYGVVTFAFGVANFFGSPILGALSDCYGRRPVLLIGFCGFALNFFATALATSLWMLAAARLVGGAMQANMSVANAYVADITPPEERAKRLGMMGAMFGIGFILRPGVGGLLGAVNLQLPFFVAGRLAMRNLVFGLLSSTLAYVLWGAATQSWMMFAIIFVNLLGATVAAAIQSIISSAADADNQGQMLGAVGGLNSLMTVIAPPIGAALLTMVSHLPKRDWRIGAPFYFCAALQAAALLLAVSHFRGERRERAAAD